MSGKIRAEGGRSGVRRSRLWREDGQGISAEGAHDGVAGVEGILAGAVKE